ncbi:putative sugar nucleotidyl transferase [Planctomicrobium sp. SH664]|uniref:putative sugar nucleotidyl transferase n=1 Tax=Planctomicrobium sp. SH664 TaxID=3448125 RepID=UPI003F5B5C4D
MRRIVLFEDLGATRFSPIALFRPVFELLCGHFTLRERLIESLPVDEWGGFVRPHLAETYAEQQPQASVNDPAWWNAEPTLWVNGRCLFDPQLLTSVDVGTAAWIGDTLAAVHFPTGMGPSEDWLEGSQALQDRASELERVDIEGTVLHYPWDLVSENAAWLQHDFQTRIRSERLSILDPQFAVVGDPAHLFIQASARIDPFVVVDVTQGPVWIAAGVRIQAFTRIEGPCYIGPRTQLFRANLREGTSIGPVCRIGGEVEGSIVHGFANKYHDGFLGHSYVCPWVNLGALTSNSDLKSDYSDVSVPLEGVSLKTGSMKVGCFIGDHTKTAIGTLFNTGTAVGVMSLILPGGELLPKYIPSFSRVWHGSIEPLPDGCESGIRTAQAALARRDRTLTPAMERLIRTLYAETGLKSDRC